MERNSKTIKTAYNKRLGEIGVKVITRTSVRPLTVSDSPKLCAVEPQLRQAAARYLQAAVTVQQKKSTNIFTMRKKV